jgi:2'-5' RNA ligase
MTSCMTWPVPVAGPERERLTGAIGRLAAEHGGPVFAPHVTLVDAFDGEAAAVAAALGRLVGGVPPFDVTLAGFGHEPAFFRALYLRAEPSARLVALHEAGERTWGLTGRPPYRPHISLLYSSDLPEDRKPAVIGAVGVDLPVTIRIDAAELWVDSREPVAGWRRVARVPLAG